MNRTKSLGSRHRLQVAAAGSTSDIHTPALRTKSPMLAGDQRTQFRTFLLTFALFKCDTLFMTSREFIRRARAYAHRTGQSFRFDSAHGKGSHGRVYDGTRFTTVQRGELGRGADRDAASVGDRPKGVLSDDLHVSMSTEP